MTKKAKILIFFALIFLVLILYLVLTSESVKKADNSNLSANRQGEQMENQTPVMSEEDYKIKVKEIFSAFEKSASADSFTSEIVSGLKNQTQSLKAPSKKFIDLQTNLFIALAKMENYLNRLDDQGKKISLEMADKLKTDYSWLNN